MNGGKKDIVQGAMKNISQMISSHADSDQENDGSDDEDWEL